MTDFVNPSLDHRLAELQQVATDLRAERRSRNEARRHGPGVLRLALGRAVLAAATALLADRGSSARLALR